MKLFILIASLLMSFSAQAHLLTELKLINELINEKQSWQGSPHVYISEPIFISADQFNKVLLGDCQRYFDRLAQFANLLTPSELQELDILPLEYTQKKYYEVDLNFQSSSKKIVVSINPKLKIDTQDNLYFNLKIKSRSMFCDLLINNKLIKLSAWSPYLNQFTQLNDFLEVHDALNLNLKNLLSSTESYHKKALRFGFNLAHLLKNEENFNEFFKMIFSDDKMTLNSFWQNESLDNLININKLFTPFELNISLKGIKP